jgi:hypothetical protein
MGWVQNGLVYLSNYKSGLRIVDVSSVAKDPTGADFFEAAFFDGAPCSIVAFGRQLLFFL